MRLARRSLLGGLAASVSCAGAARAQGTPIADSAGRSLNVPAAVQRVFPAGPPAALLLYTLAPELLLGWPRAITDVERPFLLPEIAARPEIGRLTGRGNTANLEQVLALRPDLIVDVGSTARTYVELADRVQAQTGIAYALLDGRFEAIATTYATLGALLGRSERAGMLAAYASDTMRTAVARVASLAPERRPSLYMARGASGLETGLGGSINVEIIEFMGLRNVAAETRGGLATVSMEQLLRWDPDIIVAIDRRFAQTVRDQPSWRALRAVREGRVHLAPSLPFGWVDFPPSVNRLMGLWWLGRIVHPAAFPEDIRALAREFHRIFYHVAPSEPLLDRVLG